MKRLTFASVTFCALLATFDVSAQDTTTTTTTTTTTYVPTTTVVGARVLGPEGAQIGQISDVVLDKQSGCMAYVVLSTDQGGGHKLVAAPWSIFSAGSDNRTYTVKVEKEKLYSAPVWESSHIAEYNQASWISNVYSYYGVQPQVGINIQSGTSESTRQREQINTRSRQDQTREQTADQGRTDRDEQDRSQRNQDMLTQPSPGRHSRHSADYGQGQTRADREARREQRRERRQQRQAAERTEAGSQNSQPDENSAGQGSSDAASRDHRNSSAHESSQRTKPAAEQTPQRETGQDQSTEDSRSNRAGKSDSSRHRTHEAPSANEPEQHPTAHASPTP
jgi:sporulation protein YlmC with PRC-barrel domain